MFFFNIDILEKEAASDPKKFILLLEEFYYKKLPQKLANLPTTKINLAGASFLLNPAPLFKSNIDINYRVQYVSLAGRREYGLYKQYGTKSLQLTYYPDLNKDSVKSNPLLEITKTEIYFLYEELQGN